MATMSRTAAKKDGNRMSIRLPEELAKRIARIAEENGISESDVVRMALKRNLPAKGKAA